VRPRLVALLSIAVAAGAIADLTGNGASADRDAAAAAATPAPRAARIARLSHPCPLPARFRTAFVRAAEDARLPLAMLVAVATVESGLRPGARSEAGAHGLLQLMPSTAAELHLDPHRSETNVLAGARYLRAQLDRFGSTDLALAAYNAGPTAVARAGGAPSGETRRYVARVTRVWRELNGCT
jgi:soluble lytic murein transglycosylase-like protein